MAGGAVAENAEGARDAVFVKSEEMEAGTATCRGYDFNNGVDYRKLMGKMSTHGFQATNFGLAVEEINNMRKWSLADEPIKEDDDENDERYGNLKLLENRKKVKTTIFMGFTSNQISCGNREVIRWLCEHKMVDCLVTTGGGVEEDIMKCFATHFMGDFGLDGATLRSKGINRIGNLLVPNKTYCHLENWMFPILDEMLKEQKEEGKLWTPSRIIHRLGERINDPSSVWYWCAKNNIPVFSPAITDGAVGDNIYFHSVRNPGDKAPPS